MANTGKRTLKRVFKDIRQAMVDDASQVTACRTGCATASALAWETRLTLSNSSVKVHCRDKPLRADLMQRLRDQLKDVPEMLDAQDYPENVLKWIEDHLGDWETGDLLGCYCPKRQEIDLYWLSIVLSARRHDWSVPDLTRVVFIHEWAHAFTHLGADSDGQQWETTSFCKACEDEGALIEGLAQYWTYYSLRGPHDEGALRVFLRLMKLQPAPYRTHMAWIECAAADRHRTAGVSPATGFEPNSHLDCSIRECIRTCLMRVRKVQTPWSAQRFTYWLRLNDEVLEQDCCRF